MMPPVSLPLNGGTSSARAGAQASIPHMATKLAAPIIRIADSISLGRTLARVPQKWIALSRSEHHLVLVRIRRRGKKGRPVDGDLAGRCCRVALDLLRASRHRRRVGSSRRIAHARPLHNPETTQSSQRGGGGPRAVGVWPPGRGG